MTTFTELGTDKFKSTATELSKADITVNANETLLVGCEFQGATPPATATWEGTNLTRNLIKTGQRIDTTNNFGVVSYICRVQNTHTRTVKLSWSATPNAATVTILKADRLLVKDDIARSLSAATGAPSVGPTGTLHTANGIAVAYFGAEGPNNDTQATGITTGWTLGQWDGTAGVPPVSNVILQEAYRDLSASTAVTVALSGATARNWANIVVTYSDAVQQDAYILAYAENVERVLAEASSGSAALNALGVYMQAYLFNSALPATPGTEFLNNLGITSTDYTNAVTLIGDAGIAEVIDGIMYPKGLGAI